MTSTRSNSLNSPDTQDLTARLRNLLDNRNSLMLASTDSDGQPLASYAPFCFDQGALYIFISELAPHTRNLLQQPKVSILLIEDEATCQNPFRRQRLNCQVRVSEIPRTSEQWPVQIENLHRKLGATVALLKELTDFRLLRLTPGDGTLICGFGQAYRIQGLDGNHFEALNGR